MAVRPDYIFVSTNTTVFRGIRVFTHTGSEITYLSISTPNSYSVGLFVTGSRLYDSNRTVYSLSQSANYHSFTPYQFATHDFNSFYVLTTNTLRGDITQDTAFNRNRVQKYVLSTNTWTTILSPEKGYPQLAQPYDLTNDIGIYADNRKNFAVIRRNNKTLIFFRDAQASSAGISYFNETDNTVTNVHTESWTGSSNQGLPYSMDFALDERSDGIYVYTFVAKYVLTDSTFTSATLKVYRERVEPSAAQSEIFSETFTGTSDTDEYPISVSDIILADDRSKFYFVLEYHSESATEAGKSELCEIAKSGSGSRTVLKTYNNPLLGARSPAKMGSRYFYLEGQWVRLTSDDDAIPDKNYYPDSGGHLIEINADNSIIDHGIVWRSRTKLDSPNPDPEDPQYDGWGLHNAVISNMVADNRDNLRFIAGYGLPYQINNNLPTADITGAIPDESNFVWVQWGQDLSTKIPSFPTNGRRGWELIQQLAQLMNWEIGFGPAMGKVDAVQAAEASITDWSANASFFFRPSTILPAKLRTAITASRNPIHD